MSNLEIIIACCLLALSAIAAWFAVKLQTAFRRFRIKRRYSASLSAPSVSVCIAARNERHAMTDCLERVLASDYAKMEVLVFDDESADETSALIKAFAHAGVRFVPGTPLPQGWLGRNHAMDVLAQEASGHFILFLGVDTHIKPNTISQLVGYALTESVDMVSVIPGRADGWRGSVLFGSLRYYWELITSTASKPAVSTSLWMVKRSVLTDELGGFAPVGANVAPEEAFAAHLTARRYHCLVDNPELGVTYEKKWLSQLETSRRLLYPMSGANFTGALLSLAVLSLLNIPTLILISAVFAGWSPLAWAAAVLMIVFMSLYGIYAVHLWRRAWWTAGLLWPVVIFQELIFFVLSVIGYATRTITWKGRPVGSPVAVTAYSIDR